MKFYESGKLDQIMPSGHMAHALPRTNFKAAAAPQVKASVPNPDNMARTQAIIAQLRSVNAPSLNPNPRSKRG